MTQNEQRAAPLADQLRDHANCKKLNPAWDDQARMLMKWAADAIDAANAALLRSPAPTNAIERRKGPVDKAA